MNIAARLLRLVLFPSLLVFTALIGTALAGEDDTFGSWSMGQSAPGNMLAVHSTLLRNGKILVVAGSSYNCCFTWGHEEARLFDIGSGTWSAALATPAPYGSTKDAFCSAHAHDNLGGVIFEGGLLGYGNLNGHGIPDSARYDVGTGTFTAISGGIAHWYATMVAGTDHLYIFPGAGTEPSGAATPQGNQFQKLAYGDTAWTMTGVSSDTVATYPRVSLLPNGKLFIASPAHADLKNYLFDPDANMLLPAGTDVVPESGAGGIFDQVSWMGTGVLLPLVPSGGGYPQMRFALLNGIKPYVKDLGAASTTWQVMGTRQPEMASIQRFYGNSTMLPTGQVILTGGVSDMEGSDATPVLNPEVYDPYTNNWLLTTPATVTRNYHGVALLLPDGRVWTASSSKNHSGSQCNGVCDPTGSLNTEVRVEIFTPWYVGASRPVITTCPANIATGGLQFNIGIGSSQGTNIGRVMLMRAGSVTHSFDTDQRAIQLDIVTKTSGSVTVKSPYVAAAAPPGDYMLFALKQVATTGFKQWVPSVACWTQVATPAKPDGASIWKYTGTPCTATGCASWQQLDNNPGTVAVSAGGAHHEQRLYQLHNDGAIWQYTNTICQNGSCPGWSQLDSNPSTTAIASAGTLLYQLHNDGSIWRYTNTPCNSSSCPGWERLDNNTKTIAIAAGGMSFYQLHNDGTIWSFTGAICSGNTCAGWQQLDNNTQTTAISAADNNLYELHLDGSIWRYIGTPCIGASCPGWERLDDNAGSVAIGSANSQLYQIHSDGKIWQSTGPACSGDVCGGWKQIDGNSKSVTFSATGSTVYQLQSDGGVWHYTGTPCSSTACPGWEQIDNNSRTGMVVAADPATMGSSDPVYQLHTDPLYQLHGDGSIWRYTGQECDGDVCPGWDRLDDNSQTVEIAGAGGQLFQRHSDGSIWRYLGTPCVGDSCPAWQKLDSNASTKAIAAGGNQLFQFHSDGSIWRFTGTPCSSSACPGWEQVDNNPKAVAIVSGNTSLFQIHNDGSIWRYTGTPCKGSTCPGWQQLDNNTAARKIVASGNELFQLHADGSIWHSTGIPCSGATCSGWQQLDNNSATTAIATGGNKLYQLHSDGSIWRSTGIPCSAATCSGWEQLDNNAGTKEIAATGNHLYQRHSDGRIWRYTGPPCSGASCPGWRQLDDNPSATRIVTGGFN
ncbi:MAG TPA: tectonin domain-containing protein [Thermoanaerobaculia bacterium]|jgi:hypothetical protein|nr:tectonin domain-containing protein [Thermoanaerobaculia bacterium]